MLTENAQNPNALSQTELSFVQHLLPMLLQILSSNLEKRSLNHRQPYGGIYGAIRDTLKAETFELVIWLISPRQNIRMRMFAVNSLISQANTKNLLFLLLQTSHQAEQKFTAFLWDLMYKNTLDHADLRSCQELKDALQKWRIISLQSTETCNNLWEDVCNTLISEADKQMNLWEKQMEANTAKCIMKYDFLVKNLSEDAMSMTRLVVDAQNTKRKSFIEEIKLQYSEDFQISLKWSELIDKLTHEKAVWHFSKSYPIFWELDSTEGPSRIRKRLVRCHLEIDEKYFLPSERYKLNSQKNLKPLAFLFEKQTKSCTSMVLIEKLHNNEKIRAMFSANIVTPATEIPGEVLIGETCIYFVADDKQKLDIPNTAWLFEDIKEIHNRRFELQEKAIEIFLINGKTYFLAFETSKERDALMLELAECNLPNRVTNDNLVDLMQLWREGLITNWEYLTHLNKLAGRSYNDLMQYPVFPFILCDYSSSTLDLNNRNAYRNFKKPMAIQEKKNEQHYINNYNELLGGLKQVSLNKEPYHYGSHYSNSGTVLHFLVRLPPFTKMLLQYQDKNFDLPDRTFHSLNTTWRLASSESTTDVKELIPEFFFLPEFLTNFQRFNFGVRQNGEIVDNVLLPPWCKGDSRKFILVHRQALESDYVTENLPHWIDLVFGFKQTGKPAIEAINVFHPATYCGFNVEAIADPVERAAWETMVKTYGQTPKQLFKTPHPFVMQSLFTESTSYENVVAEVKGLKWGCYVGSPAEPEPVIILKQQCQGKEIVGLLVPLSTNDVLGLPSLSTCLLQYSKEKGMGIVNSNGIRAALVSWGYSDGVIRIKLRKDGPIIPLVSMPQVDPVTICVSEPGCNHLWIGHKSGNLTVYKFKFVPDQEFFDFFELPVLLQGHKSAITCIAISRAYSIAATTGLDGEVIIWDLNHVSYVRSLNLNSGPIKIVVLSDTLGDIATVTQGTREKQNSINILYLYTVNGGFVGSSAIEETVTSMCFSTAPEGISINVIACGLNNGIIRLYSTWDLTRIRDICIPSFIHSVVSVTYSYDSQFLYASFRDGSTVVWESSGRKCHIKASKLLLLKI